jgi:hypothetical protein
MSEIKRYIPAAGVLEDERIIYMRDNDKGEWVRHTDHLAALNQAKIEAIRGIFDNCALWHDREYVRVDSIERYIEQLKEQGE